MFQLLYVDQGFLKQSNARSWVRERAMQFMIEEGSH